METREYMNIKEAARFMGRSEKTVRNRLKEIPHYYGPLGVVFKRKELEDWMCQIKCNPIQL